MKVMDMMKATTIKQFEDLSLQELNLLQNKQLVNEYNYILDQYRSDRIANEVIQTLYGSPIVEIVEAIEENKLEHESHSIVPGSSILVFPGIKEVKALKEYTCDFSGARIGIGSLYVSYRPMLKNVENGDTYVLKRTMKVEPYYEYYLPTNISELEEFNDKISNYQYYEDEDVQYDHLYIQTGGGLKFKKLNRRKYENRNN
jgi:hypothetical protein